MCTRKTQIPINSLDSEISKFVSRKLKAAFAESRKSYARRAARERARDRKTVSALCREFFTRDLLSLREKKL